MHLFQNASVAADDIPMLQLRQYVHLLDESVLGGGVLGGQWCVEQLDGNHAALSDMNGSIDGSARFFAEPTFQSKGPKTRHFFHGVSPT